MEWFNREKKNAVLQMAKHYLVEELAGAEHEAGHWEFHELEAHVGRRWRMVCHSEKKRRTQQDKKDFVTLALDTWNIQRFTGKEKKKE